MSVLVGYIPNAYGEAAVAAAVEAATMRKEDLVVLNMARDDVLVDPRRADAQTLERIGRDLEQAGLGHEVVAVKEGSDAAEAIIETAREREVSLVVIGIRHRSPVGKLLLGSIAQQVLLDAPCPVLAVKPA